MDGSTTRIAGRFQHAMGDLTEKIQLTLEERELLLKHGYPFDRLEMALRRWSRTKAVKQIAMSANELEILFGELSRSINRGELGSDEEQVVDLCARLEYAENHGDGDLDMLC